ncbi:MAG TPA: hypothetical protein VK894_06345, partial [Jiangellales bacterium]|nr:hypothetical protein [Jiangellales bacterium]
RLDPDTGALSQISPLGRRCTTRPLPPLGGALAGPSGTTGRDPAAGIDPDPGPCERRLGALLRRTPATGPPAGPHTEPGSAPPVIEVHPRRHHRPSG